MSLVGLGILLVFIGIAVAILVSWALGVLCVLAGIGCLVYAAFAGRRGPPV